MKMHLCPYVNQDDRAKEISSIEVKSYEEVQEEGVTCKSKRKI